MEAKTIKTLAQYIAQLHKTDQSLEHPEEYNLNLDQYVHYPKAHSEKGWNAIDHLYNGYKFIIK